MGVKFAPLDSYPCSVSDTKGRIGSVEREAQAKVEGRCDVEGYELGGVAHFFGCFEAIFVDHPVGGTRWNR